MFAEDGELNHPWGFRAVGRGDIRSLLTREHEESMAASRLTLRQVSVQSDDHSGIVEIQGMLEGVRAPNGRAYDLPHSISAMFIRSEKGWEIRTMTPVANVRPG